jgi:hypothetical protein
MVVPSVLRDRILQVAHAGHPGMVIMKQRLRTKVWWPNIDSDIEQFCRQCYGYPLVAKPEKPEPMQRTALSSRLWEHLADQDDLHVPVAKFGLEARLVLPSWFHEVLNFLTHKVQTLQSNTVYISSQTTDQFVSTSGFHQIPRHSRNFVRFH